MYQSEFTQFLNQLKQEKPQLEAGQRQGRALLWDKTYDPQAQAQWQAARVPQSAYVYQTTDKPSANN